MRARADHPVQAAELDALLPFLRWHTQHVIRGMRDEVTEDAALVRTSSSMEGGGGGWNCARQACLSLRACRAMLVQHPAETAAVIASDSALTGALTQIALSLGNETLPNRPISELTQELEECAQWLVSMQVKTERGFEHRRTASEAVPAAYSGLSAAELGELRIVSSNFGVPLDDVVRWVGKNTGGRARPCLIL